MQKSERIHGDVDRLSIIIEREQSAGQNKASFWAIVPNEKWIS